MQGLTANNKANIGRTVEENLTSPFMILFSCFFISLTSCPYISNLDVIDDVILTPFYLTPNGTYEIYDYELNIRNVIQSNKVNYFKKKTGKKSLEEINQEILKKLQLCYIEIEKEGNSKAVVALKKYLEYLLTSHSFKERIPEALGRFDNTNLYFEVFFKLS